MTGKTLDSRIDWAVKNQKFTLTPTIETTPNQISNKKQPHNRYGCNRYAPKDYKLWGKNFRGFD